MAIFKGVSILVLGSIIHAYRGNRWTIVIKEAVWTIIIAGVTVPPVKPALPVIAFIVDLT
jgi:hypothetical protein